MASKIFMGDMPELMENILNNLNTEIYSLYSCALVSRNWCKMSIPILWQDPFSFDQKPLFISKYFSSLGEDEKLVLERYDINVEFSNPLFDYARFLKILDLNYLKSIVQKWIELELEQDYNKVAIYHITNLLFKLFIESGATLYKLDLCFSEFFQFDYEIFYTLGENKQFFSHLQDLSLKLITNLNIESVTTLLKVLKKDATKISALKIDGFNTAYLPELFPSLTNFIKSQEQLRRFSLIGSDFPKKYYGIISALDSQKNSLQEIIVEDCAFNEEFKVLENCKNLETLLITHCDYKILKNLNIKVSSLEIISVWIDVLSIVQILENSGLLLESLKLYSDCTFEEPLLLDTLKFFCLNIKYLHISDILFSLQLLELIRNLQKLQFLSLSCFLYNIPEEDLKIRVMQFAENMPLTLKYLVLGDNWLSLHIDILLNHCNAPLEKLLIDHLNDEKNVKALIEFCKRTKSLNYVGVRFLNLDVNIRKEVEEYVTLAPYEHINVK